MKNIIISAIEYVAGLMLIGSIVATFILLPYVSKAQKVQVCHIIAEDHSNTRTMDVEQESLRMHISHGDYLGACNEDEGYYFRLTISPNPYFEKTNISYILFEPAEIIMDVYDQIGNLVKTIVNQKQEPGNYTYSFTAKGLRNSSGFHYLKVRRITAKEEYSHFERLVKLH